MWQPRRLKQGEMMIRHVLALAAAYALTAAPAFAAEPPAQAASKERELVASLKPQQGEVAIPAAKARIRLGQDFVYLDTADAKKLLVEGWGNPPDAVENVIGVVLPAGKDPMANETWGAVVTYEKTGYVTDDDAKTTDYAALLKDMQAGESEMNERRREQGYPEQHLVGWAQSPSYDPSSHSMVWARNIRFGDNSENTLNYDVRLLGRHGVLSLNLITGMSQLDRVRPAAASLASRASFDAGARYADFNPDLDEKAGYGLAGLVAAGAGAAAAKKLGLLAILGVFLKKFAVVAIAGLAGIAAWLRRLFKREAPQDFSYEPAASAPAEDDGQVVGGHVDDPVEQEPARGS